MRKVTLVFCLFFALLFSFSSVFAGRYYMPEVARWATPDPALQKMHPNELVRLQNGQLLSTSPYVYTYDNPLKYVDPDGELPQWVVGAVVGGGLDLALQLTVEGKSFSEVSWVRVGGSAVLGGLGGGLLSKSGKLISYFRHGSKVDDALNVVDDVVNFTDDVVNVADDAGRGAFEIAKEGGKHSGLLKNYASRNTKEVRNAVKGYQKQVGLHKDKLANPAKYAKNWKSISAEQQQGLLQKWQADLQRNQELADVMKGLLNEMGF